MAMNEVWQAVLSQVLVPAAVAIVLLLAGKLVNALVTRVRIELEEHDLGIAEGLIEAGIVWVQVQFAEQTGATKMARVLAWLKARGVEADPAEVEHMYQALKRCDALPGKED